MAYAVSLTLLVTGPPIVAAVASVTLLDWLAPRRNPTYWPFLAAWWFPLLLLAYGIYLNWWASDCLPDEECGGLGATLMNLLGMAAILTGLVFGPFAALLTLRYLRKS